MSQPPSSESDPQQPNPEQSIQQQAENTNLGSGQQATQGDSNIQNQGNDNSIGNTRYTYYFWQEAVPERQTSQPENQHLSSRVTTDSGENERLSASELSVTGSNPVPSRRRLYITLIINMVITLLLLGVRSLGILEGWDLKAYDYLLRLRRDEGHDRRLLVVTIDETDLQYQKQMGMEGEGSLKDAALAQLLEKLEPHKPRTIGLNIYRDFPVRRDQTELARKLNTTDNFFAVCKPSDPEAEQEGVAPPPEVPPKRLGFSDVVPDKDGVLRRHLWYMTPNLSSPCLTERALSLQLALHYLVSEDIKPNISQEGSLLIESLSGKGDSRNTRLKRLESPAGAYQRLDNSGYQMLLNYRTRGKIAEQVSLRQILTEDFNPNLVVGRIVLIGVTAPSVKDGLHTPYSQDQTMPGVFVQAQMVSQIISAVLDERPLLGVWPQWGDALWIWSWSLVGGVLAWRIQKIIRLGLAVCVAVVILYGACFVLFIWGTWVPLVPSVLAAIATGGSVAVYTKSLSK